MGIGRELGESRSNRCTKITGTAGVTQDSDMKSDKGARWGRRGEGLAIPACEESFRLLQR